MIFSHRYYYNRLYVAKENFKILLNKAHDAFDNNQSVTNDIFEISNISTKNKDYIHEKYFFNINYGISQNLNRYSGYKKPIDACIEHGVYFGNYVNKEETILSGLPAVITFSDVRRNWIRAYTSKPVITIGPYIHYTEEFYSTEKFNIEKERLGKTLLVFPTHSIDDVDVAYDIEMFIKEIKKVQVESNVKSVLCCLYWKDILNGLGKEYLKENFYVVTAGYRNDKHFLSKLKSIISLSDITMSNDLGTHLGYCVYLGKPHYIFEQHKKYYGKQQSVYKETNKTLNYKETYQLEKNEIVNLFNSYSNSITESQYAICNKYWGFDQIKSRQELYISFALINKLLRFSKGEETKFINKLKNYYGENPYIKNFLA